MLISPGVNSEKIAEESVDRQSVSIVEDGMILLENGMSFIARWFNQLHDGIYSNDRSDRAVRCSSYLLFNSPVSRSSVS